MINPAEEIVNIWLQEHRKYFTISNLVVPQKTRTNAQGRRIGGGRGKEIDFFATNGNGKYYWIEVSVSPNPRLPGGADKSRKILVDNAIKKFDKGNEIWLRKNFKVKAVEKWFVYSPKLFSFFRHDSEEEILYCNQLQQKNIKAVSFAEVLKNVYDELSYYGYDFPRQYIFLLKKMGYERGE
jgi:hypothetical protein